MKFVIWMVVNALALAIAAWLLDGISVLADTDTDRAVTVLLVALIFGLVNAVVRPIVTFFSFPFIILTLGLLVLVINALMLLLTGWIAEQAGIGFHVGGFWTAVWGGIIITVATWILELVLPDGR